MSKEENWVILGFELHISTYISCPFQAILMTFSKAPLDLVFKSELLLLRPLGFLPTPVDQQEVALLLVFCQDINSLFLGTQN